MPALDCFNLGTQQFLETTNMESVACFLWRPWFTHIAALNSGDATVSMLEVGDHHIQFGKFRNDFMVCELRRHVLAS